MTTISAKVILDSISRGGNRLTAIRAHYPRWIHAEVMTHRHFSRNSASSRAIPVKRMIEAIQADPAVPLYWGSNQPGMQAGVECDKRVMSFAYERMSGNSWTREEAWLFAMQNAIIMAEAFSAAGYHKQIINRLLEPFMHISVLITSTQWKNFFALRIHEAAEPHIRDLAIKIKEARDASTPNILQPGEWHLPYVDDKVQFSGDYVSLMAAIKLSVARCAHLSYETVEGEPLGIEQAERIYAKLIESKPMHASPAEHQATPDQPRWRHEKEHGNLVGWRQYRKMLPGECA